MCLIRLPTNLTPRPRPYFFLSLHAMESSSKRRLHHRVHVRPGIPRARALEPRRRDHSASASRSAHDPPRQTLSIRTRTTLVPRTTRLQRLRSFHSIPVDGKERARKSTSVASRVTNAVYRSQTRSTSHILHSQASVSEVNCSDQSLCIVNTRCANFKTITSNSKTGLQ